MSVSAKRFCHEINNAFIFRWKHEGHRSVQIFNWSMHFYAVVFTWLSVTHRRSPPWNNIWYLNSSAILVNFLLHIIRSIEFPILQKLGLHSFGAKNRRKILPLLFSVWARFPDFLLYQGRVTLGTLSVHKIPCSSLLHTRSDCMWKAC
jgi:hypothetical protein